MDALELLLNRRSVAKLDAPHQKARHWKILFVPDCAHRIMPT